MAVDVWGCGVVDLAIAAPELGSGSGHEASIHEAAAGSLPHGVSARAIRRGVRGTLRNHWDPLLRSTTLTAMRTLN